MVVSTLSCEFNLHQCRGQEGGVCCSVLLWCYWSSALSSLKACGFTEQRVESQRWASKISPNRQIKNWERNEFTRGWIENETEEYPHCCRIWMRMCLTLNLALIVVSNLCLSLVLVLVYLGKCFLFSLTS